MQMCSRVVYNKYRSESLPVTSKRRDLDEGFFIAKSEKTLRKQGKENETD